MREPSHAVADRDSPDEFANLGGLAERSVRKKCHIVPHRPLVSRLDRSLHSDLSLRSLEPQNLLQDGDLPCVIRVVLHRADSARTPAGMVGRPVACPLFHVQNSRNPRRCHATTVAGCSRTTACRHSVQIPDNDIRSSRSTPVRWRRGRRERSTTGRWCLSAKVSK